MHMKNNSYHNEVVKKHKSYLWTGGIISREFFLFISVLVATFKQSNKYVATI
jgi:hypothetical protein